MDWGYDVLVTDVDLVWFQSPYTYTEQFPEVAPRRLLRVPLCPARREQTCTATFTYCPRQCYAAVHVSSPMALRLALDCHLCWSQADVLVSNDCHANRWQLPGNATEGMGPNLGFSYLRSNPRTRALMEMWLDCQHTEQAWDQSCFKMVRH